MWFRKITKAPVVSPVLVLDALGVSNKIRGANAEQLLELAGVLNRNYLRLRKAIPFGFVVHTANHVFGSGEFSSFRLNDMFIVYSDRPIPDAPFKYLITASLAYQALLLDGFIPRGGMGIGTVLAGDNSIVGAGFLEAYEAAEHRGANTRDICAIQLSPTFLNAVPRTEKAFRLLCFYERQMFLHPYFLHDPALGQFSRGTILERLAVAGANSVKLDATARFLDGFEDYDAACKPGSQTRKAIEGLP